MARPTVCSFAVGQTIGLCRLSLSPASPQSPSRSMVLETVGGDELASFKRTLARMQENIDAETLNQNRTARTRLWQLMKDARREPAKRQADRRRA